MTVEAAGAHGDARTARKLAHDLYAEFADIALNDESAYSRVVALQTAEQVARSWGMGLDAICVTKQLYREIPIAIEYIKPEFERLCPNPLLDYDSFA